MVESKSQELNIKLDQIESLKEAKDDKFNIIYHYPNNEGVMKKQNEVYESADRDLIVKTFNAIKEKIQASSPRKRAIMGSTFSVMSGMQENPFLKQVTTPQVKNLKKMF